ncbi:hypothetical protein LPJ60_002943 [Coemansia sp. RSA 2675]|uniref:DUF423 domain-containing protein n=1 Tax=Coemansia spiralis TaxID=417178 RepID=A0A9W8L575_9FUNG|nr:hypothetical protein LPJ60_002943 [Coemansia sp. RSA 2675]KAJ2689150.1 hypothetical protein IWW39_001704 [Coemansia spiralis]
MSALVALRCAAVLGASGVALGAFGAHGLKKIISEPDRIQTWDMAARYQLIHAAALLALSASARHKPYVVGLWAAGTVMFSGSIYCLVLNRDAFKALGPVTPLGGMLMIAGWLALLTP